MSSPQVVANMGYGQDRLAPGRWGPGDNVYQAAHHMIQAHVQAYRLYDTTFRYTSPMRTGKCGIAVGSWFNVPKNPLDPLDMDAAEKARQFHIGWFLGPILGTGDYPSVMKAKIQEKSQISQSSRLPTFTFSEILSNKGAADFVGLNYFTSRLTTTASNANSSTNDSPSYEKDLDVKEEVDPSWTKSSSDNLYSYPVGLRTLLSWVRNSYGNMPIYITENGLPDNNATLEDAHRITYHRQHLNQVLKAIKLDGCNVKGYTIKSLLDSFEWNNGFSQRYGLYHVDFGDSKKTRTQKASAQYYANVIKDNGFMKGYRPMVTLYHWDLPQALQDAYGGFLDTRIQQDFVNYARVAFTRFGDRVKFWITFNEPPIITVLGYGQGAFAPGNYDLAEGQYKAGYNLILAHAKTYRMYQKEFKASQRGEVGITINQGWAEPLNALDPNDARAAERSISFYGGWFAHPILVNGDYPKELIDQVAKRSKEQGLAKSRLPAFTEDEKKIINGSSDFLGSNFYSAGYETDDPQPASNPPNYYNDKETRGQGNPNWVGSGSSWLSVTPFGIRKIMNWFKYNYNNIPVYITENGISDRNASLHDEHRIHYYRLYISEVLKAIKLDGCNVKGYTAWSLMDNLEWNTGYDEKFGLHSVDFNDPARPRTPKASAWWYKTLIQDGGFKHGYTQKGGWATAPQLTQDFLYGKFPDNFTWAMATASYQIEGAWNEDGKGQNIWDLFSHTPGKIDNRDTGDEACDSYHQLDEDLQMIKDMGMTSYRFSISWSRVMPSGTFPVNSAGIAYYKRLIEGLLSIGVEPMVTLYHWDLPQALQDKGGWYNPNIVQWYTDYASLCFSQFGDKVKRWITFNEPWVVSVLGYGTGEHAPGLHDIGNGTYLASHNLIKSHAEAYHRYQDKFKATQQGEIGITLNCDWFQPKDPIKTGDVESSERGLQFFMGWFAHPIFVNGDYPAVMKEFVAKASKDEGLKQSRLPQFTAYEMSRIVKTADFLGLNHYTSNKSVEGYEGTGYFRDRKLVLVGANDSTWLPSGSKWLFAHPIGIRKNLNWIRQQYGDIPIYITENGVSDRNSSLDDVFRVHFYQNYINEVLKAIRLDGIKVRGYTAWSLMDNFEWARGYSEKFGVYAVDFSNPNKTRTPKASARFLSELFRSNGFIKGTRTDPKYSSSMSFSDQMFYGQFPEGFSFGVSAKGYNQLPGKASNTSVWDLIYHGSAQSAPLITDDFSHFMQDVSLLRDIKPSFYSFTISWSVIMPTGRAGGVNKAGVDLYNNLIDSLLDAGVEPVVALHQWNYPASLQASGGWLVNLMVDEFLAYAKVCFDHFGDRVKAWATFSEPERLPSIFPTLMTSQSYAHMVYKNVILAHAQTYKLYKQNYNKGVLGIGLSPLLSIPINDRDPGQASAAHSITENSLRLFADPIFLQGDEKATTPFLSDQEKALVRGTSDFFGLTYYNTHSTNGSDISMSMATLPVQQYPSKMSAWNPKGLRQMLNIIRHRYNNPPVVINGNGVWDSDGSVDDSFRSHYIIQHVDEVLKAIRLDGCDVRDYTYTSLFDSYDYNYGTQRKFGLVKVDFSSQDLKRTLKKSAMTFKEIVTNKGILKAPCPCLKNFPSPVV